VHIALKSEIRDAYDSLIVAGKCEIDVLATDTVEQFKVAALAALAEFSEMRTLEDKHRSHCKFLLNGGTLSDADNKKSVAQVGLQDKAEVHVLLPSFEAPASPSSSPARRAVAEPGSPASPKVRLHVHLKEVMRDAYDSCHSVGQVTIEVLPSDTVQRLKMMAFGALGEFDQLSLVEQKREAECKVLLNGRLLPLADDAKTCAAVGLQDNAELTVFLPIGHDSILKATH